MREIKISRQNLERLFETIGGEEGLQRILNQFYQKMSNDILIGFFFTGRDLTRIATMQKTFLMRAWGVTQSYSGKSPADAHKALPPILKGHFDRRLKLLEETLAQLGVAREHISTWVEFESRFRGAVQAKP